MKRCGAVAVLLVSVGVLGILVSCGGGGGGDSSTTYYFDADADGYGDVDISVVLDESQSGWVLDSTDCVDDPAYGASIHPAAIEICSDWIDNNCDDLIDCYDTAACAGSSPCAGCVDGDSDGYFAVSLDCYAGNDCADADSTVNPGVDADGDTLHACQDCDDADSLTGAGTVEVCNGLDDDCDMEIDEDFDIDGDGYTTCSGDCDDTDPDVNPGATETCNGVDDDCDNQTDEDGSIGCSSYFRDSDGDGYGVSGDTRCLCVAAAPYTASNASDCYDGNADARPGQTGWFDSHRGDGSYDYDCDLAEEDRWTNIGSCSGAVYICSGAVGWSGFAPACGQSGTWFTSCPSTFTCDGVTTSQTQECR